MPSHEYNAEQALTVLLNKIRSRNSALVAQIQAAIDAGKDVAATEALSDRRKKSRAYRKTVPLTHEEALKAALDVLQAYFVEQPLFVESTLNDLLAASIGVPTEGGLRWNSLASDSSAVSLVQTGVEKQLEIELQTETQLDKRGEETMLIKRSDKSLIEDQQKHILALRDLMEFASE